MDEETHQGRYKMKVQELKKILETMPDDLEVIMSTDSEGNGFSPLADCNVGRYIAETAWSGEVIDDEDLEEYGYTLEETIPALVLNPIN